MKMQKMRMQKTKAPEATPTVSIRLTLKAKERLDKATARTRRSRSFLMAEALERHLDEIEREEAQAAPKRRLETLRSLAGAGRPANGPRSAEDIDAHIRWLRGDE